MKPRTIFILVTMMIVVLATSAFGVYNDSEMNNDDDTPKHHKPASNVVGASGAGTSYKHSKSHLDVSEKADGPYVKDGTNTYRGKAGGYDLNGDSDSEEGTAEGGGGRGDDDNENQSDFQKKMKYISNMFEEIFSKWKSQETIMAPSGIEELVDPDEGFTIRDKFKKGTRQGMRKLKNAFQGRFK